MSEDVEMEELSTAQKDEAVKHNRKVYLPGQRLKANEELVCDLSAYHMFHEFSTGAPCLSFDTIPDDLGSNRTDYPHTAYLAAGTQADRANRNNIIVMKLSNLQKIKHEKDEDDSEESDSEESDDENSPKQSRMDSVMIKHHGCVNRIRCTRINNRIISAAWSEVGKVSLFDLNPLLEELMNESQTSKRMIMEKTKPLFVFNGHQTEGYGMDWCETEPGVLATGDCRKNIHVWKMNESSWVVDQRPLIGHNQSVEDLQWSPNEKHVLASCSVDKSLRIWDTRESGAKACKIVIENAHKSDVNVISWNKFEPLIVSGGDDGFLHIWDLRNFKTNESVATFKHHTEAITTVEWNHQESSVFASGGEDNQIAIWDLALERDDDDEVSDDTKDLPPQLLFIHQGQNEIKELHWHKQIPGTIISTASNGFNCFKTISV